VSKHRYSRPKAWPWISQPNAQADGGPIDARMLLLVMSCVSNRPDIFDVWRLLTVQLCSSSFGFIDDGLYYRWMHVLQSRLRWPLYVNTWQPEYGQYNGIKV